MPYKKSTIKPIQPLLQQMDLSAQQHLRKGLRNFATRGRIEFQRRIRLQVFRSFVNHPLSPDYLQWKVENDLDPRVMIRTSHYVKAIRVIESPSGLKYVIGFQKTDMAVDEHGEPTELPLWMLALIQEYGTETIPPRPHWMPQLRAMQKACPAIAKDIRKSILDDWARMKAE